VASLARRLQVFEKRHWRLLIALSVSLVVAAAAVVVAILYGELPDQAYDFAGLATSSLHRFGAFAGFVLLYIEESGLPLGIPGDVFVMYTGSHVPPRVLFWISAWLGLIAAVVLGASNLYLISRRWGRRLADSNWGPMVHITPEHLASAEGWFRRRGVLAIIFGRHIPGFRVPITVAAGVLRVHYPTFAVCVAISTGIWAGVFMILGIAYGSQVEAFLAAHRETYLLVPAVLLLLAAWWAAKHFLHHAKRAR